MIQIFVDSGANLSAELREQYNIHLLPMALTIDDQPAPEGLDGHEYYEALRSGADARALLEQVLGAFELEVLAQEPVEYRCYCSRDRVTMPKRPLRPICPRGTTWCISAFLPASAAAGGRRSWPGTS